MSEEPEVTHHHLGDLSDAGLIGMVILALSIWFGFGALADAIHALADAVAKLGG